MGYDSIQMARPRKTGQGPLPRECPLDQPFELVLCTAGMTKPVTDACPPGVQMKRAARRWTLRMP